MKPGKTATSGHALTVWGLAPGAHMISIYRLPGLRTGDKRGRVACLGFDQSRVVAGFARRSGRTHRAGGLPGRQINENVTRKLGLVPHPAARGPTGERS